MTCFATYRSYRWSTLSAWAMAALGLVSLSLGGCDAAAGGGGAQPANDNGVGPPTNDNGVGPPTTIDSDTTFESLTIETGTTTTTEDSAVVTVTGDTTIDGTLTATDGRLVLRLEGDVTINGTLRAVHSDSPDLPMDTPFDEQPVGIYIIVGDGEVVFGEDAVLETNGNYIVTDDETVLTRTPGEVYDEVEDVTADDLPTLVPLPPDNPAFDESAETTSASVGAAQALPPVTIGGTWPPPGAAAPAGDRPVVIFRFNGSRTLNLRDWTVNGPAAPAGAAADETADPGDDATGRNGKNGLRLNIWNNGGPINIQGGVVLNLADAGDGGSATAVCSSATGGNGGKSGNFRMTAAGGIDLTNGTLTINPGAAGDGGDATVNKGAPGAGGCPGAAGADATATGGNGGDNKKRLFARGNVAGLANVTIGDLFAGDGGNATANACDGGPGDECCDGGPGGDATATGGKGGDASLNLSGLPVTAGTVFGGDGGDATATGGNGGDGGDCKFFDAGDGGAGGSATATSGAGGSAANSGAGGAVGGDSGDATATGGDGGDGGDSGFGDPGSGGDGGTATATLGAVGAGDTAGTPGTETEDDGDPGADGGALPVTLFCFGFAFVQDTAGVVDPGVQTGPVFDEDGTTELGTMAVDFRDIEGAQYFKSQEPTPHIGIQGGEIDTELVTLELVSGPVGEFGGIRIAPLYGEGIDETHPLVVQALNADDEVIGTQEFTSVPDNQADPDNPETFDAVFDVTVTVTTFRIIVPQEAFVTIIQIYLLDP